MKNEKQAQWLDNRVQFIRGLKSPNEQQRLLLILSEKQDTTAQEMRTLSLLIQAERSAQKAQEARTKVMNLIHAEKRVVVKAERKARDHALYQSAGLLILAGLVDSKTGKPMDEPAALLGALVSLNDLSRDNPKWSEWKIKGDELLKTKK
ncbi:conjugal transfer protein TraD [Xenorhabdus lircayensis]|uniref:Conjugal transfer protein TraD n=1 Tax=Xenorhabdus lircayensis TaxID=2763499 RepID=A0ABS0U8A1_9GAMM|nr:conjugal transfer protein TraD [Xenorhabdus lircayensis]MBI6550115.1 conjugal transfer protein TraD [Xenorhabdus lircayensis]